MPKLAIAEERWPIAGSFTISRGAKTEAHVVTVTLTDGAHQGRGECVPYPRYEETVPQVMAALEAARAADRGRHRPRGHSRAHCTPCRAQRARLRAVGP